MPGAAFESQNYPEANRLFAEAAVNKFEDPFLCIPQTELFCHGDTAKGVSDH
jgi:hypothetical protein